MKKTFQEQVSRISAAYHQGKLNPYCPRHSFVGHLMDHKLWHTCTALYEHDGQQSSLKIASVADIQENKLRVKKESQGLYELYDLVLLDNLFLNTLHTHLDRSPSDALFIAIQTTVALLKDIHNALGEACHYEPIIKAEYNIGANPLDGLTIIRNIPNDLSQLVALFEQLFKGNLKNDILQRRNNELKQIRYN